MRASAVLAVMLLPLLVTTASPDNENNLITVFKCCGVHQMLSSDGESCVDAAWPGSVSAQRRTISPPLDGEWVRRWLPPGLPLTSIGSVVCGVFIGSGIVSSVNASSCRDDVPRDADLSRSTVVFLGERRRHAIARPKPGGGHREAEYCLDAAALPLGPFGARVRTQCSKDECARACCPSDALRKDGAGRWACGLRFQGFWTPSTSSLAAFDAEFPHALMGQLCERPRLLHFEERFADWSRHTGGYNHFRFSTWTTCFGFHRSGNGSLKEGLFYCDHSRITRGVYWLLRPLCILSTLLLTGSLLSVACNTSMRRKIHGRCLASHAVCLLAFNIGQVWYYATISDRLDKEYKQIIPPDIQISCKHFALLMYFVLTAAWFWLTALCVNMATGFRLHKPRLDKGSGKKFLVISAFAWGLPAMLTITCSILFTQPNWRKTPAWYSPSLMETRVCYVEPLSGRHILGVPFMKSGTALFYYGPLCCLVVSNIICLMLTLRKVHYLKRGNSVLRREEDQIPLGEGHTEGNNPPTPHTATGNGRTPQNRNRSGTTVDAKTIKLYIKIILISGGIEVISDVIMWLSTHSFKYFSDVGSINDYYRNDSDLPYRAAGYVTDFFRAVIVTWLAAPEGGYLGLVMRMLRRDKRVEKSVGDVGRRKQNVA